MKAFFVSLALGSGVSLLSADSQLIEHIHDLAITLADVIHQLIV